MSTPESWTPGQGVPAGNRHLFRALFVRQPVDRLGRHDEAGQIATSPVNTVRGGVGDPPWCPIENEIHADAPRHRFSAPDGCCHELYPALIG